MNSSPTQIFSQPNTHAGQPHKPKIAFTYQPNYPRGSVEFNCPSSPPLAAQKLDIQLKISPVSAADVDKTPRKPGDKQNQYISPPRAFKTAVPNNGGVNQSQYYKKIENSCYKSNISNFCLIQNRSNSPKVKLPPLSPKLLPKKSHTKCPSFLSHKSKNQQLLNLTQMQTDRKESNGEINQVCKCGKPVSHAFSKSQACCSKCAIAKMLEGCQLKPIDTAKPIEDVQQKNISSKSVILNKISIISNDNTKLDRLLKDVSEQKQSLERHYKDNLEGQEQNISQFYKQRKLELKTHYQKIKSAIKQSIQQDLKELELLEKQQLSQWRKSIGVIQTDIKKLEKIEQEIKEADIEKNGGRIKESMMEQFKEIVKNRKMSKIVTTQPDTMNLSGISHTTSHNLSSLNVTIVLKCFNVNPEVYRPDIYRMVTSQSKTDRSSRSSDLISASQINYASVCQTPFLSPCVEEEEVLSKPAQNTKNLLFSFEGRK